ncbi:MAG TPA: GTPase HflX [Candidatus Acidoferrales bacterium]|nr:GTPase HflX [Candidatus Acidoferrales bacterium]
MKTTHALDNRERVLLLGVSVRKSRVPGAGSSVAQENLLELEELALSAGANVTGTMLQSRDAIDPATLVGRGKLEEVKIEARLHKAPLVIVDHNLTPVQLRNMEQATDCRVIDRTQLILDIFAKHARTREGQLQVELAQLNYLLPRLTGRGVELSRLGGTIGTRGPGEQKLETDRRRIRDRVRKIKDAIETVRKQRTTRRRARQAIPLGTIALVGYTNAGKSSLFNALTHAHVLESPKMFATLDPTVRGVRLPSHRRVLLSDTVGFLRDLPPDLIAAFRATLEEVEEAALILHVTDISNPRHQELDEEVVKILSDLGVADRARLHICNKIDRLSPEDRAEISRVAANGNGAMSRTAFVSAQTGEGLENLLALIDTALPIDPVTRVRLRLPLTEGRTLAMIHACGKVLNSETSAERISLEAEVPETLARRLTEFTV